MKLTDEQQQAVRDAIAEALGDAYDCMRVWNAWNVGTMSQDDFQRVADDDSRIEEIANAAITALSSALATEGGEATPIEHRQGCSALGGYGHGVGPCDCGAAPQSQVDSDSEQ
ncbi:hypothetical protein [Caballeronia sp. LZ034LL]|uniref:hypothetical protein n=1 Tax=Caballeronia sp. LZ034LL TaxID=3038567 RepID=UPI002864260C|nr:hypothetical protein [Caballeronia sp. LZ034LL]MDR5839371.1 hypothetical protein [Caballeronia sp. LZ034LL]